MEDARKQVDDLDEALQRHLIPKDPDDDRNIYLEIRGGAGGDEAAIFAGDLFRMYSRYAENQGWQIEIVSVHHENMEDLKKSLPVSAGMMSMRN